jgi:DNA (cytosine-5)-methyltransferase 3A
MNILSLFDGMACGMLAMLEAGVKVDRYVAFEIDKYAVQTSSHNFPMIEHRGDVFQADFTEFEGFDWLVGGSPCTYWSIAQKNNRETEASGMGWELFSQYVRALHEAKPMFFIYENNKSMSKAIRESITQTFGFDAICINSALVSAQNRQRLYWVGKRNADGTYSKVEIEQPEDRGILLRDVLKGATDREKARSVICSAGRTTHREYYQKHQGNMAFEPIGIGYRGRMDNGKWVKQYESNGTEKANALTTAQTDSMVTEPVGTTKDGKSYCLTAGYANGSGENIGNYAAHTLEKGCKSMAAEPIRVGALPRPNGELSTSQAFRIYSTEGKSVNLTSQGGGAGAKTGLYAVPVRVGDLPNAAGKITKSQGRRIYDVNGKSVCISCGASGGNTDMNSSATGLYAVPICHTIPQEVTVRKYTCDIEKFKTLLREHKTISNKKIAETLNKPQTLVEHWFRKDKCFSVPDADIWFELKKLLNIDTTEFDNFVTVFETRDGVFEKGNRCYDVDGKMSTLMTGKTDNIIAPISFATPIEWDDDGKPTKAVSSADGKTYIVYEVKDGQITIKGKAYPIKLPDGFYIIRKLTVRECMRLQTVPEWYKFSVSDSQAYKMLGNGWTVSVISHLILSALKNNP